VIELADERVQVEQFVRPYNKDGRTFIGKAAQSVLDASASGQHARIAPRRVSRTQRNRAVPPDTIIPIPPTISHFVMNLPASAISFLHHYRGIYAGRESLFAAETDVKLPVVHVYCFSRKAEDDAPLRDVCERISAELGVEFRVGELEQEQEVSIRHVRDVAPNKHMFCASFRLPAAIAFAKVA
jgi:tRNA (guanine37-N1)-methyltransferase